jgi:predicted Rossmann fold nucleotide-binding protein DprA/Smf involved in DNA uptake
MHDYQFDVISRVADLPLFRATNPATSRAASAEAKKFRSQHHRQILDALAAGPAGASGIAARCGMVAHQIGKRLHELAKAGRIVETGRVVRSASGRGEREWRVK